MIESPVYVERTLFTMNVWSLATIPGIVSPQQAM